MEALTDYITECIQPKDTTELVVVDTFDSVAYNQLKQDGIMGVRSASQGLLPASADHIYINDTLLCRKNSPRQIEWLCEDGSLAFTGSREPIYRRLVPLPYETVNHVRIIMTVLQATGSSGKNYVEYGVRDGSSIEPISKLVNHAYGVDVLNYTPVNSNITMNVTSTDTFSTTVLPTLTYDYAFIDADHSSRQVLIDFEHIYKHLKVGGYVFLHDTYPCLQEMLQAHFCNDCYRSPLLIREKYPNIEMLTLPLNPGVTIIHKV
jgi:hypothetical protein